VVGKTAGNYGWDTPFGIVCGVRFLAWIRRFRGVVCGSLLIVLLRFRGRGSSVFCRFWIRGRFSGSVLAWFTTCSGV